MCVCGGESGMVDLLKSSFGCTWKEIIVCFMQLQSLPSKDVIPEEPRTLAAWGINMAVNVYVTINFV